FVRLLISDADHLGQLLLGQAQHNAALTNSRSDMIIDRRSRPPSLRLCHAAHLRCMPKRADRGLYRHQRDQGHLIPTAPTEPMEEVISGAPIPRRCAYGGVGAPNNRENSIPDAP